MICICPHCKQKYDVSEEYLQQEVVCENCGQNFVVQKGKFCMECGTLNHAKSTKCRNCQAALSSDATSAAIPEPPPKAIYPPSKPLGLKRNPYNSADSKKETVLQTLKTICPHCNQSYDISPDSIQQDAVCENCQEIFTVTRAKPCSKCSLLNPAQAFNCWSCRNPFRIELPKEPKVVEPVENVEEKVEEKSTASSSNYVLWVVAFIIINVLRHCYFNN